MRRKSILFILCICLICTSCQNIGNFQKANEEKEQSQEKDIRENQGFDLPIEEEKKVEVIKDCKNIMDSIRDTYLEFNGMQETEQENVKIMMNQMKDIVKQKGYPVIGLEHYSVMENYQKMEMFLNNARRKEKGNVILYEIDIDGGIIRNEYTYDGEKMFVMSAKMLWNDDIESQLTYISLSRIKEWKYTDYGNFCYKVCVPEPPEVTEIVDGSCIIRVRPLNGECLEYSEKYVAPLGYQGNNLLCSNWNKENMQELDYNGMFEYLYNMKFGEKFRSETVLTGIPADEFESVIMTYLPVTEEELKEWAMYDEQSNTYAWQRLGCGNYAPTHFGLSLPEVIEIKNNEDETVVLIINAVCDSVMCNDAIVTHELLLKIQNDGDFQYLGNKILNDGINKIPEYQYRFGN